MIVLMKCLIEPVGRYSVLTTGSGQLCEWLPYMRALQMVQHFNIHLVIHQSSTSFITCLAYRQMLVPGAMRLLAISCQLQAVT
jgi:hypothetical protein